MRVVHHIGAAKTGSSAIQAACVRNRDPLRELGIHYPTDPFEHRLEKGRVLSGNGMSLAGYLSPSLREERLFRKVPSWTPSALDADLEEAAKEGCDTVLYSSEYLGWITPEKLRLYLSELSARDIRPEVVYFVRNMLPRAVSSYNQKIRQGAFDGTLSDFIRDGYKPSLYARQLKRWVDELGDDRDGLRVIHYDSCKDRLFTALIEFVGFSSEGLEDAERINGSAPIDDLPELPDDIRTQWRREVQKINREYQPQPQPLSI